MPSVSIAEARANPTLPADVDFGVCLIGYTTGSPLIAGLLSILYSGPGAAVTDYGIGDVVDCMTQGLVVTDGNPAPPPIAIYRTPATTTGTRGATLTVSGVTGTSVVTKTSGTHPVGTYQPRGRVKDDGLGGAGGTIGVAGIILEFSLDDGRTWLPSVALGTATTKKVQIIINGSAVDTGVQFDFAAGTLITGDHWEETKTTPPMWGDSDLYAAGPPATGAFAAIASSSLNFSQIIITEPVATGDFTTLTTALNYLNSQAGRYKRPLLTVRFRDPNYGTETDAQYVTAFRTFANANTDKRIRIVAGSGWLTDAFRGFVYLRSGLPSLLAREQSFKTVPGKLGERIAQSPGFVGRGPLESFSIVDGNGNPIAGAHDESVAGGIGATSGGASGGLTFYYQGLEEIKGTYVWGSPVLYAAGDTTLTSMDRRVANGIERLSVGIAWTEIQGADIFDPSTFILDDDIRDGIAQKIAKAIRDRYAREFQNADDPNLVVIDSVVTVSGPNVTITGSINVRFYGYTDTIALTFSATR